MPQLGVGVCPQIAQIPADSRPKSAQSASSADGFTVALLKIGAR